MIFNVEILFIENKFEKWKYYSEIIRYKKILKWHIWHYQIVAIEVQRKVCWVASNPFSDTVDGALCLGGRSNYCMDGSGNTSSM